MEEPISDDQENSIFRTHKSGTCIMYCGDYCMHFLSSHINGVIITWFKFMGILCTANLHNQHRVCNKCRRLKYCAACHGKDHPENEKNTKTITSTETRYWAILYSTCAQCGPQFHVALAPLQQTPSLCRQQHRGGPNFSYRSCSSLCNRTLSLPPLFPSFSRLWKPTSAFLWISDRGGGS